MKPTNKLLTEATNEEIKLVAAGMGFDFSDADCDFLRKEPLSIWSNDPSETVGDALDDFIRAFEH